MGAFELRNNRNNANDSEILNEVAGVSEMRSHEKSGHEKGCHDSCGHVNCCNEKCGQEKKSDEECIIALKVYDSCRQQLCLNGDDIGPARAAQDINFGDLQFIKGEVIVPPSNAVSVTIDNFMIDQIIIVNKTHNSFMRGYWNIDVRYIFTYDLTFHESNGSTVGPIPAISVFNTRVTLFGSTGEDLVIATDLLSIDGADSTTLTSAPFVFIEAKAVPLSVEIKYSHCFDSSSCFACNSCNSSVSEAGQVEVTIGLFAINKLARIVNLRVKSEGFCIPPECCEPAPICPCDYFDNLDFPMDIFAPPQREQFNKGASNNISADSSDRCRQSCE